MMKEMTVDAAIENIPAVTAFVEEQLEQYDCPMKAQMQIDIAIDELSATSRNTPTRPKQARRPSAWR